MTDVTDTAQGEETDKMNVYHLPTTTRGSRNRGSEEVDVEPAFFFPQGLPGFIPQALPRGNNPPAMPLLNFFKRFANNKVCYLCEFDVEDCHTSVTCLQEWQKTNNQESFTRKNAQGYINTGWDACTKGKHKNLFPGF